MKFRLSFISKELDGISIVITISGRENKKFQTV